MDGKYILFLILNLLGKNYYSMKKRLYDDILNVKNIKAMPEEKVYDKFFCSIFFLNILSLLTIIPININGFFFEDPLAVAFNSLSIIFLVLIVVCCTFYFKYEYKYNIFKNHIISYLILIPYFLIIIGGILNSIFTLNIIYDPKTGYSKASGDARYFLFIIIPFWFFWLCFTSSTVLSCFAKYNPKNYYRSFFDDFSRKIK